MDLPRRLHHLDPRAARFCLAVERFARRQAAPLLSAATWCVGLSGGLDSSVLLLWAHLMAPRWQSRVMAIHLDHALRPDSSADADHCRALCDHLAITCRVERAQVADHARQSRLGLEEAGRELRYALFRRVLAEEPRGVLLLAHQADDLAEDVLLRILRGAGWPELGGMAAHRPDLPLVRPFLETPRAVLAEVAQSCGLTWREDPSNQDTAHVRNRLRLEVLPRLTAINPGLPDTVVRLWRLAELDRNYFAQMLPPLPPPAADGSLLLPTALLQPLHPALRLRLLKMAVASLGPGQPLADTLLSLHQAWSEGSTGQVFQLPGGKTVQLQREGLRLRPRSFPDATIDSPTGEG